MLIACQAKKLVLVSMTSLSMTIASIKANLVVDTIIKIFVIGLKVSTPSTKAPLLLLFKHVLYIYYPMQFKKD